MQQFTPAEWQSWERFYRANFINSLTGFKSSSLIGTINAQGVPNLGMFSSMVHIGSDPALIGYINRPVAAAPHTLHLSHGADTFSSWYDRITSPVATR